ncbi:Lrp/AsnC family transcriptional regulator [Brooklawnia cerclae]|uniref:DNA-binding Lrp family transcriptional regulator n=1 Tax=Brooklawnia cerclae TaxID=349934 RepID=A0ABX0SFL6_9ACTN|nr:Lrp/AsnC family transcriptional regulator [Brooklawnia cerclae]NIH57185.1 DNA-binding Lrp family transcriptional regulator [Brooklawnia cerclae]
MTNPTSGIDSVDARILLALDADPTASVLALSHTLGLARNTVHARLKRLENQGTLGAFSRRVDLAALGYRLTAFVEISITQPSAGDAYLAMAAIPEVVEVHSTAGDADLIAKVVARDTDDLHRITTALFAIPGILRTSTAISLKELIPFRASALLERLARS